MEDKTAKRIKCSYQPDTREYPGQQCQDEKINTAFRNLHKRIVDEIIGFCNAWNISIDEFHIKADGLAESIPHGSWQSCTDSSFVFKKYSDEYNFESIGFKYNIYQCFEFQPKRKYNQFLLLELSFLD